MHGFKMHPKCLFYGLKIRIAWTFWELAKYPACISALALLSNIEEADRKATVGKRIIYPIANNPGTCAQQAYEKAHSRNLNDHFPSMDEGFEK
jgi:predicted deacylase